MVSWGRGRSAVPWRGQAGWHSRDGRILPFSQGITSQHPAMDGEHHCQGCPSHLLTGHAQPGFADGRVTDGADGGDADGEMQMGDMWEDAAGADGSCRWRDADGGCSWGQMQIGQMGRCRWGRWRDADWEMQMGDMGEEADGADEGMLMGGMQVRTDADRADEGMLMGDGGMQVGTDADGADGGMQTGQMGGC